MFVQVIEARLNDPAMLERQLERWRKEIKPGAKGYLGSTGGNTADGRHIAVVRFESEAAAQANSKRPEQDAWMNETAKAFAGQPTFTESSDIDVLLDGGSNDAGFVQVMKGRVKDAAAFRKWGKEHEGRLKEIRPDLIGGIDVYQPDGSFISIAYFTSEVHVPYGGRHRVHRPHRAGPRLSFAGAFSGALPSKLRL